MTSTRVRKQEAPSAIEVALTGRLLLDDPLLNKGSAFPEDERRDFGLLGLLPPHVSTVEEQLERTYENYRRKETDLEKYIFLTSLQDRNETLFYRLLEGHVTEMAPIIYTPVVGAGCQQYSHIYRRPRGLYISYPHLDSITAILGNAPNPDIDVIVVTDGERILGLGDLGIGGMGIPVGKLSLYTLFAGIAPSRTLPIVLDVGTDNTHLLDDPIYLGWRHPRVQPDKYDEFIERFVQAVIAKFPRVVLQWEDFSKNNAARLLERYRDRLCTFNDDIQGTGAVTLAGLLAAMEVVGSRITEQRIVILGAGSSAIGIAGQLAACLQTEGLTEEKARRLIWLVDTGGLVHSSRSDLGPSKRPYAQPSENLGGWVLASTDRISLFDVVKNVRPTVLIGTSAQPGAFTEATIREMTRHAGRPIIFPLSNPTSKSEATPGDLMDWTGGRAIVATGSPYPPVNFNSRVIETGQCNNAFIFPGVGLGLIASGARRVSDQMFTAAARALAELSPARTDPAAPLYPKLENARQLSLSVALAVASEAVRSGMAPPATTEELKKRINANIWNPQYARYRHVPR